jgi:hypothetical protein
LLAGVALKFVPVMVTVAVSAPVVGVKLEIEGVGRTVKSSSLISVSPAMVTVIGPSVAPLGTSTVMLFAVEAVTVAGIPLKKVTSLSVNVVLKPDPEMTTVAPTAPLAGLKPVTSGWPKAKKGTKKRNASSEIPAIPF